MRFARSEGREFKRHYKRKQSIAAHPFFVPAIAAWGAALCGIAMFMLPASTILAIASPLGLGGLGGLARVILAVLAAVFGAAIARFVASKWQARKTGASIVRRSKQADEIDAIDPSQDLGSESLDAPFEEEILEEDASEEDLLVEESFEEGAFDEDADVLELGLEDCTEDLSAQEDNAWIEGHDITDEPQFAPEHADEDRLTLGDEFGEEFGEEPEKQPEDDQSPFTKLGLSFSRRSKQEFEPAAPKQVELVRAMKGHLARQTEKVEAVQLGALGVDDAESSDSSAPASPEAAQKAVSPPPRPTGSAVDRLREVPPHELSLMQMVERFAVALHDHQEAAQAREAAGSPSGREAALAEALKALALFTQDGLRSDLEAAVAAGKGETDANDQSASQPELQDAMAKLQKLQGAA